MAKLSIERVLQLSLQGDLSAANVLAEQLKKSPNDPILLAANAKLAIQNQDLTSARFMLNQADQRGFKDKHFIRENTLLISVLEDNEAQFFQDWEFLIEQGVSLEWQFRCLKNLLPHAVRSAKQSLLPKLFALAEQINPSDVQLCVMKGRYLAGMGKIEEARTYFSPLLPLDQHDLQMQLNLLYLGFETHWLGAKEALDHLLTVAHGDHPEVNDSFLHQLTLLAEKNNRLGEAEKLVDLMLEKSPERRNTMLFKRLDSWQKLGKWDKIAQYLPEYIERVKTGKMTPDSLFRHLSLPGIDDQLQFMLAKAYCKKIKFPKHTPTLPCSSPAERRLRVGFLSADFKHHPVAQLLMEVLERYNKGRFEFIAYDNTIDHHSHWRKRILSAFDRVVPVRSLTDGELMTQLRDDQLDILMDMQGSTSDSRFLVLRHRVAPVQIAWLGFLGTLGGTFNDYILADQYTIPKASFPYFSEKVIWMPDFHFPADTQRDIPAPPPKLIEELPEDKIVYCSFNAQYKINPDTFTIWMNILKRVPNSVLWLVDQQADTTANLRQHAIDHGVNPERLIFAKKKNHIQHLARLQLADIALDTWPHNSGATAIDTLWAGVPLITFSGNSMMSRVAAGMVQTLQMPELCRANPQDYEDYAVELGLNSALLVDIKAKLATSKRHSPLYQPERFTHHFERALEMAYDRCANNLELDFIQVPSIEDQPLNQINDEQSLYQKPIPVMLERADFYLHQEDYQQAKDYYQQVLLREPENPHALYGTGMTLGLTGDYEQSLSLMARAADLSPDNKQYAEHLVIMRRKAADGWQKSLMQLLRVGQEHHQAGRFKQAKSCYNAVLEKAPKHPAALHYLGLMQAQQGDVAGLEKMRESIRLQPHNNEFLSNFKQAEQLFTPEQQIKEE